MGTSDARFVETAHLFGTFFQVSLENADLEDSTALRRHKAPFTIMAKNEVKVQYLNIKTMVDN